MSGSVPEGQRRASHADRDEVVEQLRVAAGDGRLTMAELEERVDAAFAARTYAELAPLTADLPDQRPGATPAVRPGAVPARVTGQAGRRWTLALFSGPERAGRWVVGSWHNAGAVMGSVDLDLREAQFETAEVRIRAFALMGGVDVVVPDDCVLDAGGFALMGGFDESDKGDPAPSGAPVVRVRGFALMGGIDVRRRRRRAERGELEP
ncbi:MAG: DUF1707 domain-containing protein [Nocardioidaceae bacterium]|nr:DUF1707 domain-containing protein [Nocardioidaceae bacterium]